MRASLRHRVINLLGLAVLLLALVPAQPLRAHPHVQVATTARIIADKSGKVIAIEHRWTFDDAYSAYLAQGLDTNNDGKLSRAELQELAKTNVESLAEFSYFTVFKAAGKPVDFAEPKDYFLEYDGKQMTLVFTLPLQTPAAFGRSLALQVLDPSMFVGFELAAGEAPVTLADAPAGCTVAITRPKDGSTSLLSKMTEADFAKPGATDAFAALFTSRAIVACP